jgi:WD40 repeat protein
MKRNTYSTGTVLLTVMLLILFSNHSPAQEDDYLVQVFKHHKGKVTAVAFSKSGHLLATGSEDKQLVIIDLKGGEKILEAGTYFPIKDIEFFGDKQLFVSAGRDVKLIDIQNQQLALYKGNATHIWSIDYAPERNLLTAGSYDTKIRIWDVQSEAILTTLEGHEKSALSVGFSMDEKYIVSGSRDQTIRVWNAKTGELLKSFERHSGNIYDIQFHPNTRYFASASADKTIRLWDIEEGKVIKTYTGHDGAVLDVEFSPDGYFLYSTGVDGTVYIYEVATGKKLYSYVSHIGGVNAIALSNDGYFTATAGDDGKVMLWKSARYIVVDTYFNEELTEAIKANPVFNKREKGESKADYLIRITEAEKEEKKLIDELFIRYEQRMNYKYLPN